MADFVKSTATSTAQCEGKPLKTILKTITAHKQKEGAGFIVRRPIGGPQFTDEEVDPWLLVDELGPVTYEAGEFPGAPNHPHRGFTTVMYIKQGESHHEDSMGNKGVLRAGDIQWMKAASGIIHDEGKNHPGGILHGFQIWINLPRKNKMDQASYQEMRGDSLPLLNPAPGVIAKVIAGDFLDTKSVTETPVPIHYVDFMLEKGASYSYAIDSIYDTVLIYMYHNDATFNGQHTKEGQMISFSHEGSVLTFSAPADREASFLLLCGKKIKEPIVRHGPFVMNTREEIQQCFLDYQRGELVKHKPHIISETGY